MKSKDKNPGISFREDLKERLKNPKFRKAFDEVDAEVRLAVAIAEAREQAGLTQVALAKALHTKQTNISRIERGEQNLTLHTLEGIAKALHCRLNIKLQPV
jgi:ribosome-binding protein aMBF1 (putative translation factor)